MTIAEQLNIPESEFPLIIWNKAGKGIYFEDSGGFWVKQEYDTDGNEIYGANSYGYWAKYEHDSKGNQIYFEDSKGLVVDNR